ncbi:MAG: hypothetical protein K5639_00955, partial [Eubacterium sp.]|nr:hypothetical protein [Eubacterium sp.]
MKKRLISFFMVLFMILSLVAPVAVTDVSEAASATKVSTWKELLAAIKEADSEEGAKETKIALSKDIIADTTETAIYIGENQNINIDLVGHTIDRALTEQSKKGDGFVIGMKKNSILTLTDSKQNAGTIRGGYNIGDGGGIYCDEGAKLTVEKGVKVRYNSAKNGGGVYLSKGSELSVADADICENNVIGNGGGIYGGESAVVTFLGGLTKIKNNTKDDNADNDLYISSKMEKLRFWYTTGKTKKTQKQVYSDELENPSRIGILLESMTKEISDGYGQSNPLEASIFFFYNGEDYEVSDNKKNSEIIIEKNSNKLTVNSKTTLDIYKGGKLVSSKEYDNFPSAFVAGTSKSCDEAIVTLGADVTTGSEIELSKDNEITIDLNGHYIKREVKKAGETEKNGSVFHVREGATLTIKDSRPKEKDVYNGVPGGVITGGASSNGAGGITIDKDGHVVMHGGTLYDCLSSEQGGGVFLQTGSSKTSFKMDGGRIYNCQADKNLIYSQGGAIFFGDGKLDISDAIIDNNFAKNAGGAIYCRRGEMKLDNVKIVGNKTEKSSGGALYIDYDTAKAKGTNARIDDCIFTDNKSDDGGGAICLRDNPEDMGAFMINKSAFRNNTTNGNGGAIEALDDGLVLSHCEITGNEAKGYGGGVFVAYKNDINVKGKVIIKDNKSTKQSTCNDLALEYKTEVLGKAYVYSGGLLPGSWIGIGSTTDKSVMLAKKMAVYEMQYFHANKG